MDDSPRLRLLDAAGGAFAASGFAGTSVRDICQAAGVNVAAVNYYFGDKERLYIEAVKFACERTAAKYPMPDWPPGTAAWQRLQDFIHTFVHRLLDAENQPWQTQLIMRELAQPTSACAEWIRDYVGPLAATLKAILAELSPPGTPEEQLYLMGFSIVGQCLYYRQNRPIGEQLMGRDRFAKLTPEAITRHIVRFTGAALGLSPPVMKPRVRKVYARTSKYTPREGRR
jgi:AcrR family transcriptional regulator